MPTIEVEESIVPPSDERIVTVPVGEYAHVRSISFTASGCVVDWVSYAFAGGVERVALTSKKNTELLRLEAGKVFPFDPVLVARGGLCGCAS